MGQLKNRVSIRARQVYQETVGSEEWLRRRVEQGMGDPAIAREVDRLLREKRVRGKCSRSRVDRARKAFKLSSGLARGMGIRTSDRAAVGVWLQGRMHLLDELTPQERLVVQGYYFMPLVDYDAIAHALVEKRLTRSGTCSRVRVQQIRQQAMRKIDATEEIPQELRSAALEVHPRGKKRKKDRK